MYFTMNKDQTIFVVSSENDAYWWNREKDVEVDLDIFYEFDCVRAIHYDKEDNLFYIIFNKYKGKIGFYLFTLDVEDPKEFLSIPMQRNKLDIENCNIFIMRGIDPITKKYYKELILSYKTIYINTYNMMVMDLSGRPDQRATLFIHESFQLWESEISSIMLPKNKDFVSFSKAGINVLALGS